MSLTDRSPSRSDYAARQAALLDALMRGDGYPEGFVAAQADAAGRSLRRKRARLVAGAWPALAASLGDCFDPRFDAFAREQAPPAFGEGLADGLAFALCRAPDELCHDGARVELLLARAVLRRRRSGTWGPRRGVFAGAVALHAPRRLFVVARVPGAGRLALRVPLARS